MTDISVSTTSYQAEKRSWYLGTADNPGHTISGTLDVSAFTAATHYPNGYLLSGIVVGKITSSGLYAPYNDSLSNGQEVAVGFLFGSVKVPNTAVTTIDVGGGILAGLCAVKLSKLPIANNATGRGYYDAAALVDLKTFIFEA